MTFQNIVISKESQLGVIKINRPEVRNALDSETLKEMEKALELFEKDEEVGVIVFTGAGEKSFAAGADIRQLQKKNALDALLPGMSGVYQRIENASKVTIAAINGFALGGGCELALACDIRIAARHAKIGLPELNLAIIPSAGGTQRLTRLIGKGRALEMILTGEMITAEKAEQIGLVSQVVPIEELWTAVKEKAAKILSKGPLAVRLAKIAVNQGADLDIHTALTLEKLAQGILFNSEDKKEGCQAFLEKRAAQFKGR
ncbi:enoyl-CoA hydratase/isomerase family protein [Thermoflavimicrobium dichotomicum]|uniref:Enoyl-CoA hydratase n=1 Tax=Thermoflavimicrobium dichotomicum TaxID=46223 RepID=A0A1I3SBL0_9BACL|nr:enoyl-CoA hydratase-related protein [Thermoflavimicrobium dichotomicum]SFJ54931.1 enoyl-CoA hydratase [Thermoflavimicrobium dichotomicum]